VQREPGTVKQGVTLALRIGSLVRAQHMRIRTPDAARRPQRQNLYYDEIFVNRDDVVYWYLIQ
jgi:hypothetical protein